MEKNQKYTYISTKFSIDNIKVAKNKMLRNSGILTGFGLLDSGKELVTKEYYDTRDFFFSNNGITINKNIYKGKNMASLVVRYQNDRERIAFLSNMPEIFEIQIPVKDSILKYVDFITNSISELVPYGLEVDVAKTLYTTTNVFSSRKQREKYKYISINGLKITFYFTKAMYSTPLNHNKENIIMLEINSDTLDDRTKYDEFIKKVKFDFPELIELQGSDYLLGKSLLFKEQK